MLAALNRPSLIRKLLMPVRTDMKRSSSLLGYCLTICTFYEAERRRKIRFFFVESKFGECANSHHLLPFLLLHHHRPTRKKYEATIKICYFTSPPNSCNSQQPEEEEEEAKTKSLFLEYITPFLLMGKTFEND